MEVLGAKLYAGYAIIAIIVGIFLCFYGERWFRTLCCIWGFCGGALLGFTIGMGPFGLTAPVWIFLVTLGFAAIGAIVLAVSIYISIFLMGAQLGAVICAAAVAIASGGSGGATPVGSVVVIAGAVVGGVIALMYRKVVLILATATVGASLITSGFVLGIVSLAYAAQVTGGEMLSEVLSVMLDSGWASIVAGLCTLLLIILGIVRQYRSLKKRELRA